MLRCSAFARAALRLSKQDIMQLTRTATDASNLPRLISVSNGSTIPTLRAFATKTATRTKAKGPVRKKTATTRKTLTKKKAAAPKKKKAIPRRKKVVKKKPALKKKKVLSERQIELLAKKKAKTALAVLKETALLEPKGQPETAWIVFAGEKLKGTSGKVTDAIKSASSEYKGLSAAELEHYNHVANQNKAANEAAYVAWVNSYTPEQVRLANNARRLLKRRLAPANGAKPTGRGLKPIKDERQIKRPQSAYLKFGTERRLSGDFKNIKLGDTAKLITKEWNGLSAGEKKQYEDLHIADRERYVREYSRTYGHAPALTKAAAAA